MATCAMLMKWGHLLHGGKLMCLGHGHGTSALRLLWDRLENAEGSTMTLSYQRVSKGLMASAFPPVSA